MHESSHGGGGSDGIEPTGAPTAADEEIMGKLPRSRPKRQSARREALRSRAATGTSERTSTERRAPRPAHSGGVPGAGEPAPGLPRLALDGAIEVAKMPAKVSANLTLRALDAVVKGLRRQ